MGNDHGTLPLLQRRRGSAYSPLPRPPSPPVVYGPIPYPYAPTPRDQPPLNLPREQTPRTRLTSAVEQEMPERESANYDDQAGGEMRIIPSRE